MKWIRSLAKQVLRRLYLYLGRRRLRRLRNLDSPAAKRILNAVSAVVDDRLLPEERQWVERIERLRASLEKSSREVQVVDYGVGSPGSGRSQQMMDEGVVSTKRLSEICTASKPGFWALMLFKLVREFRPSTCIELGTCLGISAAYMAAAQKLNGDGRLITLEGASSLAEISDSNFRNLGLDHATVVPGRFQDNIEGVLRENEPVDFAFIDGHHDRDATMSYFGSFLPRLSRQSVVVFDDISWSEGMREAWETITRNDKVQVSVSLRTVGICVVDNQNGPKYRLNIPLM